MTSSTDATGVETTYHHDTNGNVVEVIRHLEDSDQVTRYVFDASDRVIRTELPDGAITETDHDGYGRVVEQREWVDEDPRDGTPGEWRRTRYTFNQYGRPEYTLYPDSTLTEVRHDLNGNVIWERSRTAYASWHPDGYPIGLVESESVITQTWHDEQDRPVKTCWGSDEDLLEPVDEWEPGCTWTEYDRAGRVKWRRDERGAYTLTEHDAQGRPQVTCGPFTSATEPDTCDGRPLRTETVFDQAGRVREVVHGDGTRTVTLRDRAGRRVAECRLLDAGTAVPSLPVTPPVVDPEATCRAFELDAVGRTVAETDANGRRTRFGFDAGGRLTSVTDAANRVTEYGFDAAGNMTSQRDALGRVTRYEFDAGGRRKARILPMLQRETLDYTVTGAVRRRTDFEGQVIDHEVARATDRTLRLVLPQDADVITEHESDGQRASVSVGSETVEYVREGGPRRLLSQVRRNGLPWLSHEHDLAGNRTASITHDGFGNPARRTTFGHDAASRLEWVCEDCTDPGGLGAAPTCPGPAPCPAARYAHDPQTGRLASVQYGEIAPGGSFAVHVTGAYAHDALTGGLASITWSTASGELLRLDHGPYLDEAGRREGANESRDGALVRTVVWGFDEVDRLVEERVNGAVARTFTLDAVGNRLVETRAGEGSITHGFDDNDRLVSMNGTPLQWDSNGNLLHDGARQYGWDDLGRMTEAGARGFVYDADGLKRESGSLEHVVDGSFPHAQVAEDRAAGGALVARYMRGHHPIRVTTADGAWWYLHDALGSTRALVSASTLQVTDTWDYEAFGAVESPAAANASGNRWLFAGEERVEEIELDYLRARWMRPEVGRFVSRDAYEGRVREAITRHGYVYGNALPVVFVDPSGQMSLSEGVAVVAIIGLEVGTLYYLATRHPPSSYPIVTMGAYDTAVMPGGLRATLRAKMASDRQSAVDFVYCVFLHAEWTAPHGDALIATPPRYKSGLPGKDKLGKRKFGETTLPARGAVVTFVSDWSWLAAPHYYRNQHDLELVHTIGHELYHQGRLIGAGAALPNWDEDLEEMLGDLAGEAAAKWWRQSDLDPRSPSVCESCKSYQPPPRGLPE